MFLGACACMVPWLEEPTFGACTLTIVEFIMGAPGGRALAVAAAYTQWLGSSEISVCCCYIRENIFSCLCMQAPYMPACCHAVFRQFDACMCPIQHTPSHLARACILSCPAVRA